MNKKTKYTFIILSTLVLSFIVEISYIHNRYKLSDINKDNKNKYISVVGLPDLAISTETMYVRHRTLSNSFEIFKDDPTIYTYFPSTFTISHSSLQTNISRIELD